MKMYRGRYEGMPQRKRKTPSPRKMLRSGRFLTMTLAVVFLLSLTIGGTVAWLIANTDPVQNSFLPASVSCEVTETFDKETGVKTNVNVKNTSNIEAYIRVKLVTYRTNEEGQHIGGTATIPSFALGADWVEHEGYYYYTKPVAPDATPAANLAESIQLTGSYEDADGGKQAIDVMAEAIQSIPEAAVKAAWGDGFSISSDGSLSVPNS